MTNLHEEKFWNEIDKLRTKLIKLKKKYPTRPECSFPMDVSSLIFHYEHIVENYKNHGGDVA